MASYQQQLVFGNQIVSTSQATLVKGSLNTQRNTSAATLLLVPRKWLKHNLHSYSSTTNLRHSTPFLPSQFTKHSHTLQSSPLITDPIQPHHQVTTENNAVQNNEKQDTEDEELPEQEPDTPLSEMWREIQGCKNWENLLDPLHPHLRREIIRYGEFAQACYDSFDFDPHSKYCGTCKYQGTHFFQKLHMENHGYEISRYLYATSSISLPNFFHNKTSSLINLTSSSVWSTHANWMGYIAVCTDQSEITRLGRRDILIAWRGTVTYLEWIHDLKDILISANFSNDPSVKIELGFHELYTKKESSCHYTSFSAREQILAEVKRLIDRYSGDGIPLSLTFTGHSLGAALALLSAYDVAELSLNLNTINSSNDVVESKVKVNATNPSKIPITVFSFAGPRVGNLKFKHRCESELGIKVLRIVNIRDQVPTVPGIFTNEKMKYLQKIEDAISFPWSYAHVGTELELDHTSSPFLRETRDFFCAHDLEVHLHLVDGFQGKAKRFRLAGKRDIALVNKSVDFLKREYRVPPSWRQEENKGMVRGPDGKWAVPERGRIEAHPHDTAHHLKQALQQAGKRKTDDDEEV